ncbi:putative undecaprenyl-phosphate N-acetylglucosaminyl 1-phosphate transferase [subsurface metagenome]
MIFLIFIVSFVASFAGFPIIIPRLKKAGIVGKNMNSEKQEEIAEMGGLIIAAGFGVGIIFAIFLRTFFDLFLSVSLTSILAVLSTVLIVVIIGVFDDLISIRQWIKAIIPAFAALPLMALKEGYSMMRIPFVGLIDFGIFYSLVLVPLGITGAANAVNMLAGFNGLEVGMGVVAIGALAVIAYLNGITTSLVILMAILGALVAALYYNWYPAKVLVGDVGTLTIGAVVASAVIVGNYETAGVILMIPYVVDFLIKAKNGFPYSFGIYREGKLYCPDEGAVGLAQLIMKMCGGISERNLVLVLMGIEAVFGVIAILLYV